MVWIKICGITNTGDAEVAVRCGTDALGFVFSTDSPRKIGLEAAGSIMDNLRDSSAFSNNENIEIKKIGSKTVEAVGVFVNEDLEKVVNFSRQLKLD